MTTREFLTWRIQRNQNFEGKLYVSKPFRDELIGAPSGQSKVWAYGGWLNPLLHQVLAIPLLLLSSLVVPEKSPTGKALHPDRATSKLCYIDTSHVLSFRVSSWVQPARYASAQLQASQRLYFRGPRSLELLQRAIQISCIHGRAETRAAELCRHVALISYPARSLDAYHHTTYRVFAISSTEIIYRT